MNNTIFDDVFRTMIEKMPYLAVPLINEVSIMFLSYDNSKRRKDAQSFLLLLHFPGNCFPAKHILYSQSQTVE